MEMILFIGIQGSGKSSFYKEHFYSTHVRINRDMLKTKNREQRLAQTCFDIRQPFVLDNTSVTRAERVPFITSARAAGFKVVGYFFEATTREAIARNAKRTGAAKITVVGILGTYNRLEEPTLAEGFDELFIARMNGQGEFTVESKSVEKGEQLSG